MSSLLTLMLLAGWQFVAAVTFFANLQPRSFEVCPICRPTMLIWWTVWGLAATLLFLLVREWWRRRARLADLIYSKWLGVWTASIWGVVFAGLNSFPTGRMSDSFFFFFGLTFLGPVRKIWEERHLYNYAFRFEAKTVGGILLENWATILPLFLFCLACLLSSRVWPNRVTPFFSALGMLVWLLTAISPLY